MAARRGAKLPPLNTSTEQLAAPYPNMVTHRATPDALSLNIDRAKSDSSTPYPIDHQPHLKAGVEPASGRSGRLCSYTRTPSNWRIAAETTPLPSAPCRRPFDCPNAPWLPRYVQPANCMSCRAGIPLPDHPSTPSHRAASPDIISTARISDTASSYRRDQRSVTWFASMVTPPVVPKPLSM